MHWSYLPLLLGGLVSAKNTVYIDWNVSYITANPDGYPREVIGINGQFPPPVPIVSQYDQVIIHLFNGLNDSTATLHTHGIDQIGTNYYDGVDGITQW